MTGSSSGIGAAVARLLASQGYRVALLARRKDRLLELAREIEAAGGAQPLVLECDLRRPAAIEAAFARLDGAFDGLELLVNAAGIGYRARVEELEPDALSDLFATNVVGLLLASRAALPLLRRGRDPVVVHISSVVGRRGVPGQVAYAASKAAVCSIGEGLRLEWARERIAVCTLDPGLTRTDFFATQRNPSRLADPALDSADEPEEVARRVLELDRRPRPEVFLRPKWRALAILSLLAPRLADRALARRLG